MLLIRAISKEQNIKINFKLFVHTETKVKPSADSHSVGILYFLCPPVFLWPVCHSPHSHRFVHHLILLSSLFIIATNKVLLNSSIFQGGTWLWLRDSNLSSVQFSHSVVSNSWWSYGLQNSRPSCPSPTPGVSSNSCPLSWWCHPTISFSVVPFSSCLQSFLASGSFPTSQVCASSDQSIGASASESVIPMNKQDWFPLGLLAVQGTLKRLLQCHSSKFVFSFSTVGSQQETDLCSVISVLSFYLIWKKS